MKKPAEEILKEHYEFYLKLNWNEDQLSEAKKFLSILDKRDESFYKGLVAERKNMFPQYKNSFKEIMKLDEAEKELCRNAIIFWEEKLNENQSI